MATFFKSVTGQEVYHQVVRSVFKAPARVARGRATRDLGYTVVFLETPYRALPIHTGRNPKPAIAAAEALQLIGAFSVPSLLVKIAPKFERYMNGDRFHGAYGSRIRGQLLSVEEKIFSDIGTRQAIISLWDRDLDNIKDMNDYPCTIFLQFEVETVLGAVRLCMNTVMRSNDVWLGLPYDMFQFTQLHLTLANALDMEPGWYRHTALSMHAYEDDLEKLRTVHAPTMEGVQHFQPAGLGSRGAPLANMMRQARRLTTTNQLIYASESERWYHGALAPYVG